MTAVFFVGVFWMLLLKRLTYFLGRVHDGICAAREAQAMAAAARTEALAPGHEPAAGLDGRRDLSRSPATGNPVEVHASSVRVSCCFDRNGRPFDIRIECADCRVVERGFDSLPEAKDGARAHHCEERAVASSDSDTRAAHGEAVVTTRRWDGERETEQDTQYYDQLDKVRSLGPDTDDGILGSVRGSRRRLRMNFGGGR